MKIWTLIIGEEKYSTLYTTPPASSPRIHNSQLIRELKQNVDIENEGDHQPMRNKNNDGRLQ